MNFEFLLILAVILLSTKVFGLLSERVHMPQVVGALLAGVILGPSVLGIVKETDFIVQLAEIGVILLMFLAGLDTNLSELKKTGKVSLVVALVGVFIPIVCGAIVYYFFYNEFSAEPLFLLKSIFVGGVIAATSVSITVEALREMGKLKGKVGTTILGAAIIDDIVSIILLTIITSMGNSSGGSGQIVNVLIKIFLFFLFVAVVGIVIRISQKLLEKQGKRRRSSIYGLVFCLLMSFCAEYFFGIADITGAYFAGILLCNLGLKEYIGKKINILSYLIFSPIFFASIGIKTSLDGFTSRLALFAVIFVILAIITKIIGCGLGAKLCKADNMTALSIGIGMVARGEVTLIMAQKGAEMGLIDTSLFPAIVIIVIITDLLTPIMLKLVMNYRDKLKGNSA